MYWRCFTCFKLAMEKPKKYVKSVQRVTIKSIYSCHWTYSTYSSGVSTIDTFWPKPATLLKERLWHRCFSENFVKFLRAPFKFCNSFFENDISPVVHLWRQSLTISQFFQFSFVIDRFLTALINHISSHIFWVVSKNICHKHLGKFHVKHSQCRSFYSKKQCPGGVL